MIEAHLVRGHHFGVARHKTGFHWLPRPSNFLDLVPVHPPTGMTPSPRACHPLTSDHRTLQAVEYVRKGKHVSAACRLPLGLFHGVTTNPTILQRAGVPCTVPAVHELARAAFDA